MAIRIESKAQFARVIARAERTNGAAYLTGTYGTYEVESSVGTHARHTVRFFKRYGLPYVECDCHAGQFGKPCHHVWLAYLVFVADAAARRAGQRREIGLGVCGCSAAPCELETTPQVSEVVAPSAVAPVVSGSELEPQAVAPYLEFCLECQSSFTAHAKPCYYCPECEAYLAHWQPGLKRS